MINLECDQCGAKRLSGYAVIPGYPWYFVGREMYGQNPNAFCSSACLVAWGEHRRTTDQLLNDAHEKRLMEQRGPLLTNVEAG